MPSAAAPSPSAAPPSNHKPPSARSTPSQRTPRARPPSAQSSARPTGGGATPGAGAPSARSKADPAAAAAAAAATAARGGKNGLLAALGESCALLTGVEEDWEKRTSAIKSIPPLLTHAAQLGCLDALLDGLHKTLSVQAADLRSSVVRVACSTLTAVAAEHGRAIAPLAAGVLPTLLKNLYVSVKAISVASHDTALSLVKAAPTPATLSVLIALASDSHHQTRRGCADYVAALLTAASGSSGISGAPAASERQVSAILAALKTLTADADAKVREAAARCFWVVHATWPSPAGAMRAKLDPAQQKLLKRLESSASAAPPTRGKK